MRLTWPVLRAALIALLRWTHTHLLAHLPALHKSPHQYMTITTMTGHMDALPHLDLVAQSSPHGRTKNV
jgi:hypothetical protein